MLNAPSARSSWKSLDQTWSSFIQGASLPETSGKKSPPPSPPGPLVAAGRSLREGGNGNGAGRKQKPYLLSCLSSLLSPTFPPTWEWMEKEPRWMGPNAGPPGATPASWLPCSGAWPRGHSQPGHISPHFCCSPLWWRLLPSTLCQCLVKFNS